MRSTDAVRHAALAVAAVAILLAGCSKQKSAVPLVQGKAPIAAAAKPAAPQAFAVTSAHPEQYQGQLAIALEFAYRLAGAQAFDTLIEVKDAKGAVVNGSWALDEDGKTLRFPYIKADATYRIAIKGALAAADGKTLGKPVERDVYTGPMQPAAGFASQGSVLPARDSRGLPVVSVNVKEVDVEFFRVRDGELSNFFAAYQRSGKRSGWDLDPQYGWYGRKGKPLASIADSVYANRFALDGKQNERVLSYLPIQNIAELSKPGLYFAAMRRAGSLRDQYDTSFFFVSDIGLHTRVYKDTLFVHTASLKSGAPLTNVELTILDAKGETVVAGKTDADGNALLAYTLKAEQVLTAKSGKDVSILPFNQPALDLSDFAVAGRKQEWFDVFAWSGRDLYRPGETIRLSALLRDYDGNPIKPQPLFVTLKQPDGRPYAQAKLEPKELDYFDWSRQIPVDAPTGKWQVEFRLDPASKQATQSIAFRIEEFLPERLKLDLASVAPTIAPGAPLKLDVQSDYLYGAPAAGNRFTARLTLAPDVHPVEAHA
ncbi:MAG: alpha-2-macroglobulin family protein, partial [Xanthomonadaceae bacterium]|nr:alpha-2-macroglobulin family protein [Xanthomonadaceae bacterium]